MSNIDFLANLLDFWKEPITFKKDSEGLIRIYRGEKENQSDLGYREKSIDGIVNAIRTHFSEQHLLNGIKEHDQSISATH